MRMKTVMFSEKVAYADPLREAALCRGSGGKRKAWKGNEKVSGFSERQAEDWYVN